jgi:hypothetical protein
VGGGVFLGFVSQKIRVNLLCSSSLDLHILYYIALQDRSPFCWLDLNVSLLYCGTQLSGPVVQYGRLC